MDMLLELIAAHAEREVRASYLVARVAANNSRTRAWLEARGFAAAPLDKTFILDGVAVQPLPGHDDLWRQLTPHPSLELTVSR